MNGAIDADSRLPERLDPEPVAPETASEPPEDEVEGATPPGYDWPTHGGYLGCLMGVMAGVVLGGFLGANLLSFVYIERNLPLAVFILLNVGVFAALLIGLGRLGWWLGRRYYRYYPQSAGPTWGEADESEAVEAVEAVTTDKASSNAATDQGEGMAETVAHDAPDTAAEPEATEQRPG
jgi:hypothetical protein